MRKKKRRVAAIVVMVLIGAGLSIRWLGSSERLRRGWKNQAVADVARLSADQAWVASQAGAIQKQAEIHQEGNWVGDQMLVMGNGEWIVFRNECVHRHQFLGDIFIGKASNGKWYYSSFHFCCETVVLRMEGQPGNLASFVGKYFLREFDGKSDEGIGQTWAGGSGGIH